MTIVTAEIEPAEIEPANASPESNRGTSPTSTDNPQRADLPVRTVSLRARVVVSVLVLLAVVLGLLGVTVTALLGDALRADLRQRLEDRAGYAAVLQSQGVTGQDLADQMSGGGVYGTFASNGVQFVGREQVPPVPGSGPGPAAGPPAVGAGVASRLPQPAVEPDVTFSESAGLLIADVTLPDGALTLQASENEIDHTLSVLRTIELAAGAIALLLTGFLLIRVVGGALRPLDRMTALAQRIRGGARGRRLRPTRPGTELGRTAAAFDQMLDALESAEAVAQSAEERMRQFLADASHDLRTPLAGVIVGADVLIRADPDVMDRAERERGLVSIVRQARQASRLVDDLLTMTRLESQLGAQQDSVIDLVALVRQQLADVASRRPDVPVRLRTAASFVPVRVDPDELGRAVSNLLENAANASPPTGTVLVSIEIFESMVVVSIADDGRGVPVQHREAIFDRFVRLTDDRSGRGSGLGLPIARAIARRHGGEVTCLSRSDQPGGARFDLSLPAALR